MIGNCGKERPQGGVLDVLDEEARDRPTASKQCRVFTWGATFAQVAEYSRENAVWKTRGSGDVAKGRALEEPGF